MIIISLTKAALADICDFPGTFLAIVLLLFLPQVEVECRNCSAVDLAVSSTANKMEYGNYGW